jgi:hypothetical protein
MLFKEILRSLGDPRAIQQIKSRGEFGFSTDIPSGGPVAIPARITTVVTGLRHHDRGKMALAGFSPEQMTIFIFLFPPNVSSLFSDRRGRRIAEANILKLSRLLKIALAHEIIHLLDYLRGNQVMTKLAMLNTGMDFKKYINTPHEYNAFFQQGALETWNALQNMNTMQRKEAMNDFGKFAAVASTTIAFKSLILEADKKYERKTAARLYQTYAYWKSLGS